MQPVWRDIQARALALGYASRDVATTEEADIHLLVDGRRVNAISTDSNVHTFLIRAGAEVIELASRAAVPNELAPYIDDPRQLGVAIEKIVVRGAVDHDTYAADNPALLQGWNPPEHEGSALWRWTKGRAALPFDTRDGPRTVDVTVKATTVYAAAVGVRAAA